MNPQELLWVGLLLVGRNVATSVLLNNLFLEQGGFSCIPKRFVPFLFLPAANSVLLHHAVKLLRTNSLVSQHLHACIKTLQPPIQSQGYHTRSSNALMLLWGVLTTRTNITLG